MDRHILAARLRVLSAMDALKEEKKRAKPGAGTITPVERELTTQFHTHQPADIDKIVATFDQIYDKLDQGPDNWHCVDDAGCDRECGGEERACAPSGDGVALCPDYFETGEYGPMVLIHEAGHQGGLRHYNEFKPVYDQLSTAETLQTTQAYELFVARTGAATQAVWGTHLLDVMIALQEPQGDRPFEFKPGRQLRPRTAVEIRRRFRGTLVFFMDAQGVARPGKVTLPDIAATMTFFPAARPGGTQSAGIVKWDHSGAEATIGGQPRTAGSPLNHSWRNFDLSFSPNELGVLRIEGHLRDSDTGVEVKSSEDIPVRP